jgi:predicted permease
MKPDDGGRRSRMRRVFVGAQVAGSTLFLATALLFVRSFANANRADVGFDPDHLLVARLEPDQYGYDGERSPALARELVERVASTPGVTAAIADRAPFAVGYPRVARVSTNATRCAQDCRPTTFYAVGANYFAAIGLSIRAGRAFSEADLRDGTAIVVNEALAGALWPGRSPVGEAVMLEDSAAAATVVGVAGNAAQTLNVEKAVPLFYRPLREQDFAQGFSLITRASGSDSAAAAAIRDAVRTAAPAMPIASLSSMREMLEVPLWPRRTAAGLFSVCGALALVLATVGLFGVTYFAVRQRTREFGVRVAIGATPWRIFTQVLGEGVRFVLPGAAAGLLLAALAGRLLARLLLGVSPADPVSFAIAGTLEVTVAMLACALPAREATRVDPIVALRAE